MTGTWIDRFLDRWSASDDPAVVTATESWTGRELVARAAGAGGWLDERGLPVGRPVAALVDESPVAVALAVGAGLARRPLAPLGTRLPTDDLVTAERSLGTNALVTTTELADRAGEVADAAGVGLIVFDEPSVAATPATPPGPDDIAFVVHTSGTTGAPKPVRATQQALAARCDVYGAILGLGPGDRYWSASPFHHTAGIGMALTALGLGATVLPQAWFSVDAWRTSGTLGSTVSLVVPTMIDLLLDGSALGDAAPRCLQYGGAPIHPDTLRVALDALPDTEFVQVFGQTEMTPFTCLTHADHQRALAGRPELLDTVGRAAPGVDVRLDEPDEEGVGELCFRGAHAFLADADGWVRSGDLGTVDEEGYVRIVGRRHDKIVRGGENIYPVEVEDVLRTHPGVRDVAVVGVADKRWGEVVRAVVVPTRLASPPEPDELSAHARVRLASFKVPVEWRFVDELPRNAGGKILRHELR